MTSIPFRPTSSTPYTREAARTKRTLGEDAVPVPSHSARTVPYDYRQINGWGADLDPANRPAWPRELPSDVKTIRGDVKHWQQARTKIHMSNEHPGMTPVFGEACPPSGLSGMLRDYAYQFGEASNRHWLTLMLADRVNLLESRVRDPRVYWTIGAAAFAAIALGVALKYTQAAVPDRKTTRKRS